MAYCSESILQAITGGTNSSPQPLPGQSGKRLCQRTTSSPSMTCCLLMPEPLALPCSNRRFSLPRKRLRFTCVFVWGYMTACPSHIHKHTQYIMECMFPSWLWIARCRADGAAGRTLRHCCSAEEVHERSCTASYQVKELLFQLCRLHAVRSCRLHYCWCSIFIAFTDFCCLYIKDLSQTPIMYPIMLPASKEKQLSHRHQQSFIFIYIVTALFFCIFVGEDACVYLLSMHKKTFGSWLM